MDKTNVKLSILCEPKTLQSLEHAIESESRIPVLVNPLTGARYPIIDDIVRMLSPNDVTLRNKRYQDLYDKCARWYDLMQRLALWWLKNTKKSTFERFSHELAIKPGDSVLEVSVGTGANVAYLAPDVRCYGLDISLGMLSRCRKAVAQQGRDAVLVHGMAEALPFKNASFDVVFHIGGINFFNDRGQAIKEMIRVAKPGTRFLIADETEETAKRGEGLLFIKRFFKNRDEIITPPIALVPKNMRDITLRFIDDNSMYVLTFTKP